MRPILLVDDLSEDLAMAERVFSECKILNPLISLKSGKDCLAYFKTLADGEPGPCLALIDLVMPRPNGVEVLRQLSESRFAASTAFVMLSGLADIKLIQKGYQHGARTFLVKPLQREDVLRLFETIRGFSMKSERAGYRLLYKATQSSRKMESERPEDGSIWLSS